MKKRFGGKRIVGILAITTLVLLLVTGDLRGKLRFGWMRIGTLVETLMESLGVTVGHRIRSIAMMKEKT